MLTGRLTVSCSKWGLLSEPVSPVQAGRECVTYSLAGTAVGPAVPVQAVAAVPQ